MKKIKLTIGAFAILAALTMNFNHATNNYGVLSNQVFATGTTESGTTESGTESGTDKWFSNLNPVECPISKVNGAVVIIIKGVTIPAYGTYTIYGSKKVCERELTTNTCDTADQTECHEVNS